MSTASTLSPHVPFSPRTVAERLYDAHRPDATPATEAALLTAVLQAMPGAVLLVSAAGRVLGCSAAAAALLGCSASSQGDPVWQWVCPADQGEHAVPGAWWQGERVERLALEAVTSGRPLAAQITPLCGPDAAGHVLLTLEVAPRNAVAALPSVCADLAHELRSPLLAGLVAAHELVDGALHHDASTQRRLAHVVQRSLVHLQTVIDTALDPAPEVVGSRAEAAEVGAVMQDAALMMAPLLEGHGQRLIVEPPPYSTAVGMPAQPLRQVLVNLLENASKYGPPNEVIVLRASYQGPMLLLEVADRGAGIPAEEQPLLFQRYYRGRNAAHVRPGKGLGLAPTRALVERHGGQIGVRSAAGQGTVFWFSLPVV